MLLLVMLYTKKKGRITLSLALFTILISSSGGETEKIIARNVTCEKIQSSEFPDDLFTKSQRKCGAIILHIIFAVHCFGAIAIICRERFLPTLNCLCEDLKLSDDVAAATFMSIATSAPEFFSNIIGTFITESDIGIGHIIGNGYYNMFFVAAIGGFAASKEIVLEWWPLARDCGIYALVALILTGIIWDGVIQIYETVFLILLYFIYFFIMLNNKKIMNVLLRKFNTEGPNTSQSEVVQINDTIFEKEKEKEGETNEKADLEEIEPLDSEHDFTLPPAPFSPASKAENKRWKMIRKIIAMPIYFLMRYTIPDVRVNKFRKYYPVAFFTCVIWIGVSTYLGTWMVSTIGETLGISDLIVGMIFMAAGGSVVEAYSVYYKARRGECSIGLSNSIGCNTLDITLCLALPWFIKTLPFQTSVCENGSSGVILESSLIHINSLLLLISVVALFTIFYLNNFKLDRKLAFICGGTYGLVLFIGISVESYKRSRRGVVSRKKIDRDKGKLKHSLLEKV